MRDFFITVAVSLLMIYGAYKLGERTAEARCEYRATLARQTIEDAVSRASDAISDLSERVLAGDAADDANLKDIEDAKPDAAACTVPADSLRSLDKIGG